MSSCSTCTPGKAGKLIVEFTGTALLLAAIIGSGHMGDTLSNGNTGLALLANSLAVGAALFVLISLFGPISGAHFNPAVTLAMRATGAIDTRHTIWYVVAQVAGALCGAILAHAMFELPLIELSTTNRTGTGQWIAEGVATFGLLVTIFMGLRHCADKIPALVGFYILSAFWFTASTSFANPAVTVGRMITDTFGGIAPADVLGFIAAQMAGTLAALGFMRLLPK